MMKYIKICFIFLSLFTLPLSANEVTALAAPAADAELAMGQFTDLIRWSGVFTSLIVLLIAWSLLRFIHRVVERVSAQFVQKRLLLQKLETFSQFAIYIVTAILVFNLSLRIDERVMAVIGGTLAVSVGFAMKDLVASFIAGLMIMLDRPFQVGDRLSFDGQYGDVLSIGLRSVRVNTLNDDVATIPNNKFLNDVTVSGNFGELDMHVGMDFYIGYDQDVALARNIISEAAASSRYVHLPRPIVVLVSQHLMDNYIAIKLRLKAYVLDTRYEKLFETDVNLRVIEEFNEQGIQPAAVLHRNIIEPTSPEETSE